MYPSNIVANYMKLDKREFFETKEVEKENISAKELFNN